MIKLVDAYKTYDNGTKALNGVNLEIADGEFAFIDIQTHIVECQISGRVPLGYICQFNHTQLPPCRQ